MGAMEDEGMKSVAVQVSRTGRSHLPAEVRRALGMKGATRVVLTIDDDSVRLRSPAQTLEHIRRLARPYKPEGRLASEELILERRAEARREERDG
jgi:bifunctional DNA-binding transcriptional regulator/antitoxin component of YhaV-PrlF toxin-antitoxin module